MKIGPIHILTEKKLQQLIKAGKRYVYNMILNNPSPKKTILKKELGID